MRSCGMGASGDIEKAAVVPIERSTSQRGGSLNKKRWSSRVINNVAVEIENVMSKVHLGDQ